MFKKVTTIVLLVLLMLSVFAACGEQKADFFEIQKLMSQDDLSVTALLGEGDPQYTDEEKTNMLSREYKLKVFDEKCSSSVIYNSGKVSQVSFYFDAKDKSFADVNLGLWSLYADAMHTEEGDNGSLSQYWTTSDNNGVTLTKYKDGSCRLLIIAGNTDSEGENK